MNLRGFKCSGNKKQACSGQRPSGMEVDCVGSQGSKRAVVPEEEEEENKK